MADDGQEKPQNGPESKDDAVKRITMTMHQAQLDLSAKVEEMRKQGTSVTNETMESAKKIVSRIGENLSEAKKNAVNASLEARALLDTELKLLGPTMDNLPEAIRIEIPKTVNDLLEKWKQNTIYFAEQGKSGVATAMEKSGFNKVVEGFISVGGKIGEFVYSIMEYLKPKLGKLASAPGISYLIGAENLKSLHAFLGYDENVQKLQDEIRDRLPNDVAFSITDKKEMIQFNDLYDQMLRKKNETPTKYSKGAFFNDILGDYLKVDQLKPENGKKTLVMTQILTAGKELLKNTKEVTPPATTTPPATSTPKA